MIDFGHESDDFWIGFPREKQKKMINIGNRRIMDKMKKYILISFENLKIRDKTSKNFVFTILQNNFNCNVTESKYG